MKTPLIGIFVGGRSSRMGGLPKGLLAAPGGQTVIARLLGVCHEALPRAEIVLVGASEAYEPLGLRAVVDDPSGIGPIGGLCALLAEAESSGAPSAIALACDLPYLTIPLVGRLASAPPPSATVAAPSGALWQPLFARYALPRALIVTRKLISDGERSLQPVLRALDAVALSVDDSEAASLRDWDSPSDLER